LGAVSVVLFIKVTSWDFAGSSKEVSSKLVKDRLFLVGNKLIHYNFKEIE
jgi:hypothetical protein